MTTQYNDTLVGSLRKENEELGARVGELREELRRQKHEFNAKIEDIRLILTDAHETGEDAALIINSIASVLELNLVKEITVDIPMHVTMTMTVPIDCDVSELEFGDVSLECYNNDVEEYYVDSFDIGYIGEI